jgi:hypothetical protein
MMLRKFGISSAANPEHLKFKSTFKHFLNKQYIEIKT